MAHKRQQAPGRLDVVRQFVNTWDREDGEERFADPEALVAWLAEQGLAEPGTRATKADLERAVDLREAVRALLLAHNGGEPAPEAAQTLRDTAARARLAVRFEEDGSAVEPEAGGVDGALGRLLAIVHESQRDGTWARLKACPWDTCQWAFYDNTKNRSGVWCTMEVCGNRAKARAYRERHA